MADSSSSITRENVVKDAITGKYKKLIIFKLNQIN